MSEGERGEIGSDPLRASRLTTLLALTAKLARTTSSTEVAALVLHEGVDRLGASTGSLCLVSGDELEISASVGYPESVMTSFRRFPIDDESPAGLSAISREALYFTSIEELYERFPSFRTRPLVGDPSFAVLPLEESDTTLLGTMVIGFAKTQLFPDADREFLEALAQEAGAALERARANEALVEARATAEAAKDQLTFLAEASSRLAASLNLTETLGTVSDLAVPRVGDRCALYLKGPTGQLEKYALAPQFNEDEARLFNWASPTIEDASGAGAVIRSGQPVFVPTVADELLEAAASSPDHLALLRKVGIGGTFIVPLQARGEQIGALAFVNRRERPFTAKERGLGEELAARAAVAIDNSRLFEREVRIAETLQHALLPARLPSIPGVDLAAKYLPGTRGIDVGGDWYDVELLDGGRFAFVVGDVSGHGLYAATLMASLRHAIRAYAVEGHAPHDILANLGRLLDLTRDGHFATVLTGIVDVGRREVTMANAGHPDPLLVEADGARYLPTCSGPPIGVAGSLPYRSVTLSLPIGATLLAFTDGLIERRGEMLDLGLERLSEAVTANSHHRLGVMLDALVNSLIPDGSEDDAAMLGLRCIAGSNGAAH